MSDSSNNRQAGKAPHFGKLSIHPYIKRSYSNNINISELENTGLSENRSLLRCKSNGRRALEDYGGKASKILSDQVSVNKK